MAVRRWLAVNRDAPATILLGDVLVELCIDGYGRPADDLDADARTRLAKVLVESDRGVDVHDPSTGALLLRTRAYWWGDGDDPEALEPNMEVPSLGFRLEWYKHAFRDSHANQPVTLDLVGRIREVLRPALTACAPFAEHPGAMPAMWTRNPDPVILPGDDSPLVAAWRLDAPGAAFDHGFIVTPNTFIGDDGSAAVATGDHGYVREGAWMPDEASARTWLALRMRRWSRG